jgi:hypothetical protein
LATQTGTAKAGISLWSDLPASVDIFTEFPVLLQEYGTHVIAVKITGPDGTEEKGQTSLHPRQPQ